MFDNRHVTFVYAIAVLIGVVQSRAVNISNTWMLPEEGFPVFYRYFRDRISWYEADAVCQFHHANLVTADSSSQYDAIRAYLKELDITEKVWIGLSKPQEKPKFLWTDFSPLSSEGHWQEALPAGDSQSLCVVMDPAYDFLWRALPCGGPEVAAFICELPIPSWALGPRGCLLTELPSLTVLYIPEQSALDLTSDCGLDGTKRIACKGNADREEMLNQLTCVIPNDDIEDDKSQKTSTADYVETVETSTWDDNTIAVDGDGDDAARTTKSWTSNTIVDSESTRHRRETEDTLSPVSTKSSFKEVSSTDLSWQNTHQEKVVLTTQHQITLDEHVTPTPPTTIEVDRTTDGTTASAPTFIASTVVKKDASQIFKELEEHTKPTSKPSTENPTSISTGAASTTVSPKTTEPHLKGRQTPDVSAKQKTETNEGTSSTIMVEANVEDYPSAISQGQLFSIIENGTMFDIIELNETDQEQQTTNAKEPSSSVITALHTPTETSQKSTHVLTTDSSNKLIHTPTKKSATKKPVQPTKKASTKDTQTKKDVLVKHLTTERPTSTTRVESVDEMEEKLTKEFEMMPDIKDTSVKLNRTFRKELPPMVDEHTDLESGSQYGVPRILNFTISNSLDSEDEGFQQDQPAPEANETLVVLSNDQEPNKEGTIASSVVKKNAPKLDDDDEPIYELAAANNNDDHRGQAVSDEQLVGTTKATKDTDAIAKKKPEVTEKNPQENVEVAKTTIPTESPPIQKPIDPRLYVLNNHPNLPTNNNSESVIVPRTTTERSIKVTKEEFLPKSLLGENPIMSAEHPSFRATTSQSDIAEDTSGHLFPTDGPKQVNRHRNLHNNKGRKFYPYFFSRMLG